MESGLWMRDVDMELDEESSTAMKGYHKMKDGKWMRDVDMDAETAKKEYHTMKDGRWMRDEDMVQQKVKVQAHKKHMDHAKKLARGRHNAKAAKVIGRGVGWL